VPLITNGSLPEEMETTKEETANPDSPGNWFELWFYVTLHTK